MQEVEGARVLIEFDLSNVTVEWLLSVWLESSDRVSLNVDSDR